MVNTSTTKAPSADLPFAHLGLKPKPAVTRLSGSGTAETSLVPVDLTLGVLLGVLLLVAAGVAARFHPSPDSRTDRGPGDRHRWAEAAARLALVSLVINWAVNNLAALLLTGLVPSKGIAPIPITGILIGGALTVRNRWSAHSDLWQR
ncbi:hypothetical protein AB0C71_10255 [Streptomyces anulatus]|uniref:hypothetical protein n=1 Tax=Streptomyces anulatus TaxID=1892 RepID=UPI0033F4B028